MSFDAKTFLNKAVGEDFLESLAKSDIYKPNANAVVDIEDIRVGLKVVPRIIMSMLIRELPPMKVGEAKKIPLMLGNGAILNVNKHDPDTYSGSLSDNGAVLSHFKFRPLPGVGLVIMSAFELYELEEEKEIPKHFAESAELNVQKLIDERLALHHIVGQVVEKKLMEREAIQQLFMVKIKEQLEMKEKADKLAQILAVPLPILPSPVAAVNIPIPEKELDYPTPMAEALTASEKPSKKERPLKGFLDKKLKKNEYEFKMVKGEIINCPDCLQEIFNQSGMNACICYGSDMGKKVFIKKSEKGIKISFPKSWDKDNALMLLETLKKRNK
jgi:hypothetical protein